MVIFHSKLLVDQRVNLVGQEMDRIFGRDATPLLFGRECLARRHSESSYKPQLFLVNSHMLSTCVMLGMIQRCCCCCSWRCWSCGCGCSCLLTHVCYTSQYVAGLMLRSLCLLDKSLWLLVLARNMFGYLLFNPLVVGISPRFLSELSFWLLGTSNLSAQTSWFLANSFPTFRWLDPHVCSFINPCFGCWSSPVGEISPSLVFFFAYFCYKLILSLFCRFSQPKSPYYCQAYPDVRWNSPILACQASIWQCLISPHFSETCGLSIFAFAT